MQSMLVKIEVDTYRLLIAACNHYVQFSIHPFFTATGRFFQGVTLFRGSDTAFLVSCANYPTDCHDNVVSMAIVDNKLGDDRFQQFYINYKGISLGILLHRMEFMHGIYIQFPE